MNLNLIDLNFGTPNCLLPIYSYKFPIERKNAVIYSSLHRKSKSTCYKSKGSRPINSGNQIKGKERVSLYIL
jgi:hypothetical protein